MGRCGTSEARGGVARTMAAVSRRTSGDSSGLNVDLGIPCSSEGGGEPGGDDDVCGGAEDALRDVRRGLAGTELLRTIRLAGAGRTGESSAPDWKTLLSSQPLSSGNYSRFA
jgi:hypothetical protein